MFFCLANLDEVTKDSAWWTWPEELRHRQPQAISYATSKFKQDIDRFVTIQFLFDKYWKAVKVCAAGSQPAPYVMDILHLSDLFWLPMKPVQRPHPVQPFSAACTPITI